MEDRGSLETVTAAAGPSLLHLTRTMEYSIKLIDYKLPEGNLSSKSVIRLWNLLLPEVTEVKNIGKFQEIGHIYRQQENPELL